MGGESQSDSENSEKSNSNDEENAFNHGDGEEEVISEYEKQRLERIKENKARLESLRLPSLASSLLGSVKNKDKRKEKNKRGKEEDEEYKPSDGEERASSSSNEEGDEEEEDEEEEENKSPEASNSKGKNRQSSHKSKRKTKRFVQKRRRRLDYVDDDEALKQAIALSLEDSSEVSGAVLLESLHNSRTGVTDVQEIDKRKKKRQS
ncbi:Calmodulin-related, partial [Thalictrum thalictroides]